MNQYAQWFISEGVKPGGLVSVYMTNSPDFVFVWLALWAIGAAPTMINYNLSGKSLLHCLSVSGSNLVLVDEEEGLRNRIEDDRAGIEKLGQNIHIVDGAFRDKISSMSKERPADSYRDQVKANSPAAIIFTRYYLCFSDEKTSRS